MPKNTIHKLTYFIPWVVLLIVSWWIIRPLFVSGFYPMHDDTQVARVFVMKNALADGQFPVRWVDDLGYGYGYSIFNFYSPLPYYVGGLFALIGFDVIVATKLMIGIGALLAAFSMFLLGSKLYGKVGGLLAATLYVFAPYHAVQLYVRGSVGELWAYGLLPLVALDVYQCYVGKKRAWIGASIVYAALILSHNITALLVTVGLMVWWVGCFFKRDFNAIKNIGLMFLVGLAISAFFWLPAIGEAHLTKVGRLAYEVNFRDHFIYLDQLWNSPWGYAGSAPGRADGMSFKIGKLQILLGILGLVWMFGRSRGKQGIILIAIIFTSIFMMLPISQFVWEKIPPLVYVQFPWRFLVFTLFALSLAGGSLVSLQHLKNGKLSVYVIAATTICIGAVVIINGKYFQPQTNISANSQTYTASTMLHWKTSRISDEYLPREFPIPANEEVVPQEKIASDSAIMVKNIQSRSNFVSFTAESTASGTIIANIAYFPGWVATIDGVHTPIIVSEGKIMVNMLSGFHTVTIKFTNTSIRVLGNTISAVSAVLVLGYLWYDTHKKVS